jgi:hypothetical protein
MLIRGMLIGTDNKHIVVVEQSKKSWVRHDDDGEKHLLPNPSLTAFLAERMSGNSPKGEVI